jgi:hypothetical protein
MDNETELVYCCNCRYVRSGSDAMGGVWYRCKKATLLRVEHSAIQPSRFVEDPEVKNKDNDCPAYKPIRFWHLFANTRG